MKGTLDGVQRGRLRSLIADFMSKLQYLTRHDGFQQRPLTCFYPTLVELTAPPRGGNIIALPRSSISRL